MHLSRFPRVRLTHSPTPLELAPRLSEALGGPTIWIKRDDCTGLATGGNKTRKLEWLLGDALQKGADLVYTQGAVQSNHCRQTVAAAVKLGLECRILLEERVPEGEHDANYPSTGNVFLDHLMGASIDFRPAGTNMQAEMEKAAATAKAEGRTPYVIPGGGSNPIGALGYVTCALEILEQAMEMDIELSEVVHGTGSTGTQAGLVCGFEGSNSHVPVLGISVRHPQAPQEAKVYELVQSTADFLGLKGGVDRSAVRVNSDYVGAGYGIPTDSMIEAVKLFARTEAVLLDPVYSGKAAAGLIGLARAGRWTADDNVVFVHTGGAVGLFAYQSAFVG